MFYDATSGLDNAGHKYNCYRLLKIQVRFLVVMALKAALFPSLLHLSAAVLLLAISSRILANNENEEKGLVIFSVRQ